MKDSERSEQRKAEALQRVGDRWTSQCAKADVATVNGYGEPDAGAIQRAGMPTELRNATKASSAPHCTPYWRRSPWWYWT